MRENAVVTEHTNDTEQSSPENAAQQPDTQGERLWYAIHTYSGYENKVKSHLEARINSMDMRNKIFRVIVPMEEEVEIKQGQRRTVQRKVFPGYVLVEMVMSDEAWYVVRNTPGVTSFVGSGNRPVPLQDSEVHRIIGVAKTEAPDPKVSVSFELGENVRVVDGPFTDFHGKVVEINA